jgi:flagellar FliL protein
MANKKSGSEDGEKKGNSRLRIVVIALAILVIAGGVYIFLGRGAETAPAATEVAVAAPVVNGAVIKLEPIFINLKDDRFLKLGLALQTSLEGKDAELDGSMALDAAIEVFSDKDIQQLVGGTGRSELKEQLIELVTEGYGSQVTDIYFTEFVMQ